MTPSSEDFQNGEGGISVCSSSFSRAVWQCVWTAIVAAPAVLLFSAPHGSTGTQLMTVPVIVPSHRPCYIQVNPTVLHLSGSWSAHRYSVTLCYWTNAVFPYRSANSKGEDIYDLFMTRPLLWCFCWELDGMCDSSSLKSIWVIESGV